MSDRLKRMVARLRPLQELISDQTVTEIHVGRDGHLRARRGPTAPWTQEQLQGRDVEALCEAVEELAQTQARRRGEDPEGAGGMCVAEEGQLRWVRLLDPMARTPTALFVLRVRRERPTPAALIERGLATAPMLELLKQMFHRGEGVVFVGGDGDGRRELISGVLPLLPSPPHTVLLESGEDIDTDGLELTTLRRALLPQRGPRRLIMEDLIARAEWLVADEVSTDADWAWVLPRGHARQGRLLSLEASSPQAALRELLGRTVDAGLGAHTINPREVLGLRAVVVLQRVPAGHRVQAVLGFPDEALAPDAGLDLLASLLDLSIPSSASAIPVRPEATTVEADVSEVAAVDQRLARSAASPSSSQGASPVPRPTSTASGSQRALERPGAPRGEGGSSDATPRVAPRPRTLDRPSRPSVSPEAPTADAQAPEVPVAVERPSLERPASLSRPLSRPEPVRSLSDDERTREVSSADPSGDALAPAAPRAVPEVRRTPTVTDPPEAEAAPRVTPGVTRTPTVTDPPEVEAASPAVPGVTRTPTVTDPPEADESPSRVDPSARFNRRLGRRPEARPFDENPTTTTEPVTPRPSPVTPRPTPEPVAAQAPAVTPPVRASIPPLNAPVDGPPENLGDPDLDGPVSWSSVDSRGRARMPEPPPSQDEGVEQLGTSGRLTPIPRRRDLVSRSGSNLPAVSASASPPYEDGRSGDDTQTIPRGQTPPMPQTENPMDRGVYNDPRGTVGRRVLSGTMGRIPRQINRPGPTARPEGESSDDGVKPVGASRRMSHFGTINRSASFKPSEPEETAQPGQLRASDGEGVPHEDEDMATIQRDTAALKPVTQQVLDSDETSEMNVDQIKRELERRRNQQS